MPSSNNTKAAESNQDTPETLIEALRDVVRRQRDGEFPNQAAKFAERLLKVVETDLSFLEQIVATVIPSEAMADLAIYDHLANLRNVLGYDTESFKLCGLGVCRTWKPTWSQHVAVEASRNAAFCGRFSFVSETNAHHQTC